MKGDHVIEMERGLLGAVLSDPDALAEAAGLLRPEHFLDAGHRLIWRAAILLFQEGKPADLAGVADLLHRQGDLEDAGGHSYLGSLHPEHFMPAARVADIAHTLVHKAMLRQLAEVARGIAYDADQPDDDPERVLERSELRILAVADGLVSSKAVGLAEVLPRVFTAIDARSQQEGLAGVTTGFEDLDNQTAGYRPGELVLIGARPAVGKTGFALAIARHAAGSGVPVFFVSLEQSVEELAERLLVAESRVDAQHVRLGALEGDDGKCLSIGATKLHGLGIYFDDAARQGMARISATARRVKRRHGIGLIIVDYLQLIEPDNRRDQRHEQVGQISRRLKTLARELAVPVVALAQLNRAPDDRADGRPKLSDLRESGSLEADADLVLLLHRLRGEDGGQQCIEVNVAKNRHGPTGPVRLTFVNSQARFEDQYQGPFGGREARG